jgi:hypothetical protein
MIKRCRKKDMSDKKSRRLGIKNKHKLPIYVIIEKISGTSGGGVCADRRSGDDSSNISRGIAQYGRR